MQRLWCTLVAFALLLGLGAPGRAETTDEEPSPAKPAEVKDTMPNEPMVAALLRAARVTRRDVVIVLGSGDGRVPLIAAQRFGARTIGIERDPALIDASRKHAAEAGVLEPGLTFRQADPAQVALNEATVVFALLAPVPMAHLRPQFLALRPGIRILGYQIGIADWQPDELIELADGPNQPPEKKTEQKSEQTAGAKGFVWIVPTRVAGTWRLRLAEGRAPHELTVTLTQRYQRVEGEVTAAGIPAESVAHAVVRADRLSFLLPNEAGERAFYALVRDKTMTGVATDGVRSVRFRADRIK